MSERQEVEVVLPLEHVPSAVEHRTLLSIAFQQARQLVRPKGGNVRGLISVARGETAEGQLSMKCRFAVDAPEQPSKIWTPV